MEEEIERPPYFRDSSRGPVVVIFFILPIKFGVGGMIEGLLKLLQMHVYIQIQHKIVSSNYLGHEASGE